MTRFQIILVSSATALFLLLYFGFDTKPKEREAINQKRSLVAESTDISILLQDARSTLGPEVSAGIALLEKTLSDAVEDSVRVDVLKQLSGKWYEVKKPEIAGHYASEVAEIVNSAESWSITGTTYAIGVQRAKTDRIRSYCTGRAVQAFENAISLEPENLAHRVNLALCYTEDPPQDNPMKGILMLVDLNKQHPENVLVLTNLARLAIKTGQFEKAVERLQQAVAVAPDDVRANCMLAQALEKAGKVDEAAPFQQKCLTLSGQ